MTSKISAAVLLVAAAQVLCGCVGTPASEYEQRVNAECPVEPSAAEGEIRLGYQVILGTELYVRDRGLAEACMPNADLRWIRFPTGQDVVKGLASDSIDVGFLGSTPSAKALSEPLNLDVVIPRVSAVIGDTEALVAKDDSITSITDLRGARIAVPFSSTAHYSLLNALRTAGLDPTHDVELVNLSPDALPAAWQSDDIDAAYVWDPVLAYLADSGHIVLTSTDVAEAGAPTYNFTLAARSWTDDNPELLATWLDLQDWAARVRQDEPEEFAQGNANEAQLSVEEILYQLDGLHIVGDEEQREQLAGVPEALERTSAFLAGEGEVAAPLSSEQARDAVVFTEEGNAQ
ncbi:taurine ABC transporter substrate-binding protein [Corynebacterium auris]|uniref:taurine ABC transporter substrate-binding protein n=1 Tax=Corynebacterium auris TaxID=44750 RepID=UPI0025B2F688|nr:ABC transporter substrate-binding protein [Corynebacterium auris]WJY66960.1 Taurine-binding periplasmic protein precursor [Corynebacterium auris]